MSDYWTGTLAFEDIANDQLDDMEITVGWGAERPSNDIFPKLKRNLKLSAKCFYLRIVLNKFDVNIADSSEFLPSLYFSE
jgi:hypothetical protein